MANGSSQPRWGVVTKRSKIKKKCLWGIPFAVKPSLCGATTLKIKEF